jgi:hypothetical protein
MQHGRSVLQPLDSLSRTWAPRWRLPVLDDFMEGGEEYEWPGRRRKGIPPSASQPIASFRTDQPLKRHPDYRAAKSGDAAAAVRLIEALVQPDQIEAAHNRFGPDVTYVPVVAQEASGHNAIPRTLAEFYAARAGARTAQGIYQANRTFHTGAGAMERLATRALFAGPVERGARYVIVDDAIVMGSTIAELAHHIQCNGGAVVGAVALVNAGRSGVLVPAGGRINAIRKRFGDAVREIFDIDPGSLTADEAEYVLNFRDSDALRARCASARRQRDERLRTKGIR